MSQIISFITAIIFLVATIIGVIGALPWWVIVVAVLLFVVSATPPLYRKASAVLLRRRIERQEQKLVHQHWGELRRLATELHEVMESSRMEIASIMYDSVHRVIPDKQDYYNPQGYKIQIYFILDAFLALLDSQVRNRSTFTSSAQLLESLYRFWHELVMKMARKLKEDIEAQWYTPYEKENYNKFRKWHTDLLDDYVRFAKTVNADFGETLLRMTTHEPLPDTW